MKIQRLIITLGVAALVSACGHTIPPVGDAAHDAAAARAQVMAEQARKASRPSLRPRAFMASPPMGAPAPLVIQQEVDREQYASIEDNPVKRVAEQPVSTFSIDVDTGAYANVRRMLMEGRLPPSDAVRIEELVNYFSYADPAPADETPFRVNMEFGPNPWNARTHLLRVAIKARQVETAALPPANLVFLVDVSGSMHAQDKLPLLKRSLNLLARELDGDDKVSIVVYAGASGVVLEPTPGDQAAAIEQALAQLQAGGSTNGGEGIRLAYAKARESFIDGGINRVLIATDGDFNVGTVDHQALLDLVEREREAGISLTTLGFGRGNYNDHLMEQLADHGNGNHAYIDSLLEARKVLVEQMGGTLHTLAKDVKIQIEFNPARVSEYRLIGYENRLLAREDFNNDQVDAGEVGAGHSVMALYEVALVGEGGERIEPLRYANAAPAADPGSHELAFVRLRYKQPDQSHSRLLSYPLHADDKLASLAQTSDDYRFSAAVAAFGQKLRGGKYLQGFDYGRIIELARASRGDDRHGYRSDFLRIAGLAQSLQPQAPRVADGAE